VNRAELEALYDVDGGVITSPGAFEGAPVWAPYYWDHGLAGLAHESRPDGTVVFRVAPDDALEFPELSGLARVGLREDERGLVRVVLREGPNRTPRPELEIGPARPSEEPPASDPGAWSDTGAVPAPGQHWTLRAAGVRHGRQVEIQLVDAGRIHYRDVRTRGGLGPERRASVQAFVQLYMRTSAG
jgi:hypothetical protein